MWRVARRLGSAFQRRRCVAYEVAGLVDFEEAHRVQEKLMKQRLAWQREEKGAADSHDVLLLLQHESVYTLGRRGTDADLLFGAGEGLRVVKTDRGGKVTWHGPGQLVGYALMDLNFHHKDLHWYLRGIEQVLVDVLDDCGQSGERDEDHTGVWVRRPGAAQPEKVAAIGINASRWVTMHGFGLNVHPDMSAFSKIVPCGIRDKGVCSLEDLTGEAPDMQRIQGLVIEAFRSRFDVALERRAVSSMREVAEMEGLS